MPTRAILLALLLGAAPTAGQMAAGFAGVEPSSRAHIADRTIMAYEAGPARIRGRELRGSGFPTGHQIIFTGTPTIAVDACVPPCDSDGASIISWDSGGILFDAIPSQVLGGFTVQVVTPEGTSNAVPIEAWGVTRYLLPAVSEDNLAAGERWMMTGFEYGCDAETDAEPCTVSTRQWTAISGTPEVDFSATSWTGDANDHWALRVNAQEYVEQTITAGKEVSWHAPVCPLSSWPAGARTIVDFRHSTNGSQAFVQLGSDGIVRAYYGTTGNLAATSAPIAVDTCAEVALLQDASLDSAGCARVTLMVDGIGVGDSELCGLTISDVNRVRVGSTDGVADLAFPNVVGAYGYDLSVAYLRVAALHPTSDDSPNAWTRTTPQRSACAASANFECVNDMAPSGMCSGDLTDACSSGAASAPDGCGSANTCNYVDGTPTNSIDEDQSALFSTTSAGDQEEFGLTDITLGTNPDEKFAAGTVVTTTCWWEEQNSNSASKTVCAAVSDGSTARCGTAIDINGFGASAYYPLSQRYATDASAASGCTTPGVAPCWSEASVDGLRLRLQNPSAASADTRVRASACLAEVEITRELPSYEGGNPLPVAMAFLPNGDLYLPGEYSAKIYRVPDGATDGATASAIDIRLPQNMIFGFGNIPTRNSALMEDIDVFVNAGTPELWFTQGGGLFHNGTPGNASRVVRYIPSTGAWSCYNIPVDNFEAGGVAVESATSVYVAGLSSTTFYRFDPTQFDAVAASCVYDFVGAYPAGVCGSQPCFTAYVLGVGATPFDVFLLGGDLYVSNFFGNNILQYDFDTDTTIPHSIPPSVPAARIWQSSFVNLGAAPQFFVADGSDLYWAEFTASRIGRLASGVMTSFDIPDRHTLHDYAHSVLNDDGAIWVTTQDDAPYQNVWTGTTTTGASGSAFCTFLGSPWEASGSNQAGTAGRKAASDATWTDNADNLCHKASSLICVEQGTGAGKRLFATSTSYSGDLGGLSGADASCAARATVAGLSGTYKAWLSTASTSASSRLDHNTGTYVRTDGVQVADDWADLTDGTLDAPIARDEFGRPSPGVIGRLDTDVSPLAVDVLEPITAYNPAWMGGFTAIEADPTTAGRVCAALGATSDDSKSILCLDQKPPPSTFTPTASPTRTGTPTITPTPIVYEHGTLFGLVGPSTNTAVRYFETNFTSNSTEARVALAVPRGIQVKRVDIACSGNVAASGSVTQTFQLRRNAANVSGASCTITQAASPAACAMTGLSQDYAGASATDADEIDLTVQKSGAGTAATVQCTVAMHYVANGGATEADAIVSGGGQSITIPVSSTRYCGPSWGATGITPNNIWSCGGTSAANSAWLVPASCTLSGLAIKNDSALPSSVTETYTVKVRPASRAPTDSAGDLTTNLSVGLSASSGEQIDTTCSSNCAVTAGDRVFLEVVSGSGGTPTGEFRRWAISCDGESGQTGQLAAFALANSLANAASAYGAYNTGSTLGNVWQKATRAFTARNLYVMTDAAPNGAQRVVLRTHASDPTQLSSSGTDTALTCTTASSSGSGTGNNWCASGTHCCRLEGTDVAVAQGAWWVVAGVGQSGSATTNAFVHVGLELSNGN